jgi:hypothetical protein
VPGLQLLERESERAVSAGNTTLWELAVLRRSFHPAVASAATDAIALTALLPSQQYREQLRLHDTARSLFTPAVQLPRRKRDRRQRADASK